MGASNATLPDTVTAAAGATTKQGVAGATITAGQVVYYDNASGRYELAQCDTEAKAALAGVALNSAKDGQPLVILEDGIVQNASGLTAGKLYVLSDDSAGAVMESADLGSADYATFVGIALSATSLHVKRLASGVALA